MHPEQISRQKQNLNPVLIRNPKQSTHSTAPHERANSTDGHGTTSRHDSNNFDTNTNINRRQTMPHTEKIHEIETAATRARDKFAAFKKETLEDPTLSTHGKQKRIEERHKATVETLTELRQTHGKIIAETEARLKNEAFPSPTGADAMQFDHYVYEMSRSEITPAERLSRLEQAGSDNTRQALAKAAFIAGDYQTLEAFAKMKGDAKEINTFLQFRRDYGTGKSGRTKLSESMLFSAPSKK